MDPKAQPKFFSKHLRFSLGLLFATGLMVAECPGGVVFDNGSNYPAATPSASTWIGYVAPGQLTVDAGSQYLTATLSLGQEANGIGTVILSGAGTTLTASKSVYIGTAGIGILKILDGAVLTSNTSSQNDGVGIRGGAGMSSALVDGAGSKWISSSKSIDVGNSSGTQKGFLTVSNGGEISASGLFVGIGSKLLVTGRDTVTAASAVVNLSGSLVVNSTTTGSAVISAGGIVNARAKSLIGSNSGDQGAMTVTGTGSQLNIIDFLTLGALSGQGSLTVSDGGLVSVSKLTSAMGTGDGKINVGGYASSTNVGTPASVGNLFIGEGGAAGRLNVAEVYGDNSTTIAAISTLTFNHNEANYQFTNTAGNGILISGSTAVKQVAGTTVFTAASTYQGATQITGGTLLVNNATGSGTGTGAVTVSGTGTLGGRGKVAGKITVQSGGSTLPGASQILSAGSVKYESGSTAKFTIGAPATAGLLPTAGIDYDRIDLTGILEIEAGAKLELQLTASTMQYLHDLNGAETWGNYFLFTLGSSPILGEFDSLSLTLDGTTHTQSILDGQATFSELDLTFKIGYTGNAATNSLLGGHDLTVQVSSVPEPLTGSLIAMGMVAVMTRRRRKKPAVA